MSIIGWFFSYLIPIATIIIGNNRGFDIESNDVFSGAAVVICAAFSIVVVGCTHIITALAFAFGVSYFDVLYFSVVCGCVVLFGFVLLTRIRYFTGHYYVFIIAGYLAMFVGHSLAILLAVMF